MSRRGEGLVPLIIFVSLVHCTLSKATNESVKVSDKSVVEKWKVMEHTLDEVVEWAFDSLTPVLTKNFGSLNLSLPCKMHAMQVVTGIRHLKPWALKFLDATAKDVNGLFSGGVGSFGAYDECLDIEAPGMDSKKRQLRGQYCSIDFIAPFPNTASGWEALTNHFKNLSTIDHPFGALAEYMPILQDVPEVLMMYPRIGICVPSGCTIDDVNSTAVMITSALGGIVQAKRCQVKEEVHFSAVHITLISLFAVYTTFCLIASLVDLYLRFKNISKRNTTCNVLIAFSFISNTESLLSSAKGSKEFKCLNGIRFISMTWIIFAHTFLFQNFVAISNNINGREMLKSTAFQAILNATLSVDTFVFIGGFLLSYVFMKRIKYEKQHFNIFIYILHRIFRLVPSCVLLLMFVRIAPLMGSGPQWNDDNVMFKVMLGEQCQTEWWKTLLFITNYNKKLCLGHLWYLGVDMQIYIASPILLLCLLKWPKVGAVLSVAVIIGSAIAAGWMGQLAPLLFPNFPYPPLIDRLYFYFTAWPHLSAYCIGVFFGYVFITKSQLKIPVNVQIMGWTLSIACCLSLVYAPVLWQRDTAPSAPVLIMYDSLRITVWTMGVTWVVFCCITGHGGFINSFLSWKPFMPLGRLSFVAYIFHPIVMTMYTSSLRTRYTSSYLSFVWLYFAYLVTSYLIAFGGSLLVESPWMAVERMLLKAKLKPVPDAINEINMVTDNHFLKNGEVLKHLDENKNSKSEVITVGNEGNKTEN